MLASASSIVLVEVSNHYYEQYRAFRFLTSNDLSLTFKDGDDRLDPAEGTSSFRTFYYIKIAPPSGDQDDRCYSLSSHIFCSTD